MAKVSLKRFTAKDRQRFLRGLSRALLKQKRPEDLEEFLRFFLTPSEVVMFARRLLIAQGLLTGKTYEELRREYGVGLTTVLFVDRWLRATVKEYVYALPRLRPRGRRSKSIREPGIVGSLERHWIFFWPFLNPP